MRILFVVSRLSFGYVVYVLKITLFTLSAEMRVYFTVFKFFAIVYNSELILFDTDETRNIYCY